MSRIGKKPVAIPSGVEVSINGTKLIVKKGNNTKELDTFGRVDMKIEDGQVVMTKVGETKEASAYWGTYRALLNNIIVGLNEGFEKTLEINGVGYRAAVKGNILEMQLGFSHPINYEIVNGIDITVEKNIIKVKGSDKQVVGQVASEIRGFRPPEPYKGKGVKYSDERIIRKAGKTAK